MTTDRFYLIPDSLVQATLRYLSQQRFSDVEEAVAAFRNLSPMQLIPPSAQREDGQGSPIDH